MTKLLLERKSATSRLNEQYELEVIDLAEAVRFKEQSMGHWGASDYQYPLTGRVTFDDGTTNYISMNGRIWSGKYWESKNGKCYNDEVEEIFI